MLDVDGDAAKRAAADIAETHGVPTLGVPVDITDEDAVDAAVGAVESALPPVVGLANVAGVSSPVDFLEVTPRSGTASSPSTCGARSWSPAGSCRP